MSSTSQPPTREPTIDQRIAMTNSFTTILHNASLGMLIIAPVLIALPPRKLDLYTFALTGAFVASANHLVKERTGAGLLYQLPGTRLPPAALEYQERVRVQRRLLEDSVGSSVQENMDKYRSKHRDAQGLEKVARDIWMGSEKEVWKERRLREEQEKLDAGEGYGSMILDQIWDVWNQSEKKAEEGKEKKDEQLAEARPKQRRKEEEFPQIGKDG